GEDLEPLFATHQAPEPGLYPIRGTVLFGLAECERARLCADYLKAGRLADVGRMMKISHDGDRVITWTRDGQSKPYHAPTGNNYLLGLMADLESGEPERVERAQLTWQPGSYSCSLPAIDRMVDLAIATEGVAGAQLAGAGLGGCMMVLAKREAVPGLTERLRSAASEPSGQPPDVLVCRPVAGSGLLVA
ncbi:MAG TPA: galactokinase, partial [Verrucomicrobiae bacterium]